MNRSTAFFSRRKKGHDELRQLASHIPVQRKQQRNRIQQANPSHVSIEWHLVRAAEASDENHAIPNAMSDEHGNDGSDTKSTEKGCAVMLLRTAANLKLERRSLWRRRILHPALHD